MHFSASNLSSLRISWVFHINSSQGGGGFGGFGGFGRGGGSSGKPTIAVQELQPLHSPKTSGLRPELEKLTDFELLKSVTDPIKNDPIKINTKTGKVTDGNGRAYELIRRSVDPNSRIQPDTRIPYEPYTPDDSFFPDF